MKSQYLYNQREVTLLTHIIISSILGKAVLFPGPFRNICKIMKIIVTDQVPENSSVIICVTLLLPYHYGGTGTMFEYSVAICVTLLYPTTKEIQCLSTVWLFVFICLIPTTDVVQKLPLLYNWVQCYLFYSAWPPTTDKVQCVSTVLLIILLSLTPYH